MTGCAAPGPQLVNYGHPALNEAAYSYYQNAHLVAPAQRSDNVRVVIGSLAGGVIGSRFGGGDGRIAGVAVGAATGAMAAQGGYGNDAAGGAGGALVGAIIGSRFGRGDGRLAGAALGAGLGAWLAVPRD